MVSQLRDEFDLTYLLDANVFIEAKRRYYGFDLCPGFWEALVWHRAADNVRSIDRVKKELLHGGDDLAEWAKRTMPEECFASTDDPAVTAAYGRAMTWVQAQPRFLPEAKAEFAGSVDGWLIAYASANGCVLVTHEERAPESRTSVKIPDVCDAIGVRFVNTFDMLRTLETRFRWQPPA